MATAIWQCSANGRYWLDVLVGNLQVSFLPSHLGLSRENVVDFSDLTFCCDF